MNTEEDEFNRIEREASMRQAAVKATVAKKEWVELTDEDRLCAKYMQDAPDGIESVIDYINAKLKEKNCGK